MAEVQGSDLNSLFACSKASVGKDIQQGVMELLTGSIRYIRNPKSHEKIVVEKHDAVRKLHLASLLMSEIDKAYVL